MDSKNNNGIEPLTNVNHEAFVTAVFKGIPQHTAYQQFVSSGCKKSSAIAMASKLIQQENIKQRLMFLKRLNAESGQMEEPEMIHILETLARAGSGNEKLNAIKALKEWKEEVKRDADAQKIIDPAQLCAHLARFARNKPPADYLPRLIAAINALLHPSRDEWIAALKIGQCRDDGALTPHQEPITASLPPQTPINIDNNGGTPALPQ
jgi:tellurite resistance protein